MGREKGKKNIVQRLGRAAVFSAVRGLASAGGAALLGLITCWIQNR